MTAAAMLVLASCGGAPPPERGVLEANVESWNFRRYQKLLDVEVWVLDNAATAYTASYVRDRAERSGQIGAGDVASAFVTRYRSDRGVLRALVQFVRRLEQEGGYTVEVQSVEGVPFISVTGQGETWALWKSERHVIKIGGRDLASVPSSLVEAYGERYPSRIPNDILDRPLPDIDESQTDKEKDTPYDPNNPTPDWKQYQQDKAKPAGNPKPGNKPSRKPE